MTKHPMTKEIRNPNDETGSTELCFRYGRLLKLFGLNRRFEQQRAYSDFVIRASFVIGYLGVWVFHLPYTPVHQRAGFILDI